MPTPGLRAITDDHPTPPPARSGEPWTDEDYEQLVALIRDGADHDEIATGLQRPLSTVGMRTRRLLPVEERRCPSDRVLPAARRHLSDPAYDWHHVMLLSEPPRPAAPLPPPVVRGGVPGLDDDDLVTTAYGLLCAFRESRRPVVREVAQEVGRRGLEQDLIGRRADHLLHRMGETVTSYTEAHDLARRWVLDAPAWKQYEDGPRLYGASGGYAPTAYDEEPWPGPCY